ncbi:S-layer homology domain-containing protein [Paenibacillus sp. 2TAB23]|uniref:S-layer homology domain-containing protein n=1 Tax=Paenibacillus sp. 2TAB23 TaxID=3233004 RepID=UPI003F9603CD
MNQLRTIISSLLVLAGMLSAMTLPVAIASAAAEPSFHLQVEGGRGVNQTFQVVIEGMDLQDVYAFEIGLTYDANRLAVLETKSELAGFSVNPKAPATGQLRFAHTKIGEAAGENGKKTLLSIRFQAISGGQASISLDDVKLVQSDLNVIILKPKTRIAVNIGQPTLNDITGHWAETAIRKAVELGFVSGYADGSFRPNRQITRSEFVVMLARSLKLPSNSEDQRLPADFNQVPDWAKPAVKSAYAAGIVTGYEDGNFRGDRNLTRTEAVMMLARAFGLEPKTTGLTTRDFVDAGAIPAYAQGTIKAAAEAGLVVGKGGRQFDPLHHASRAETVALILSFMQKSSTL